MQDFDYEKLHNPDEPDTLKRIFTDIMFVLSSRLILWANTTTFGKTLDVVVALWRSRGRP